MQYNKRNACSLTEQMFIVSECLFRLGHRKVAEAASQTENWEFAHDFVALVKNAGNTNCQKRLAQAGLIYG